MTPAKGNLHAAELSDALLIERAGMGDDRALGQLYQPHARYVARVAWRLCGVRELHILGVYEGTDRGPIAVALGRTGAALTIVVSGYEPTTWNFAVSPGVMIERVITNGLGEQTVLGLPPGTVVVDRSGGPSLFAGCAFVWPMDEDGCDTPSLVMGVEALTGLTTTSFSGCYSTSSFTLANP